MEKKLEQKELDDLKQQYYELTETIKEYRGMMKTRKFRCEPPQKQRVAKMQYAFFQFAIGDNLRTLMDHKAADKELLSHAVMNSALKLNSRWAALKELWQNRKAL